MHGTTLTVVVMVSSAESRALEAVTALEEKNGQTLQLEGRVVELSKQLVSLSREVSAFYWQRN